MIQIGSYVMKAHVNTLLSLQTEELRPDLEERSVPRRCPEVQPPLSGRAASDGQQTGRLRNQRAH